jgi:tetratricopeptide (TPR) repeat protein
MKSVGDLLALGARRQREGRIAKAERSYRNALKRDPVNAEAMHLVGLAAAAMGNANAACVWIAAAIRHEAGAPRYYENLAQMLCELHKYPQAVACCRQGLVVAPDDALLQIGLVRAHLGAGQPLEAAGAAARFLTGRPEADEGWYLLGVALHQVEKFEDAAQALLRSLELCPSRPQAHYNLGLTLTQLGHEKPAEQAYRRALQLAPSFAEACNNLGNLLRRRGLAADAEVFYRRALRLRPSFLEARYNLGLALQSMERLDQAGSCYREVLARDPQLAPAHNNLGNTLLALGSPGQAIRHYDKAASLNESNREYRVNLGMAQLLTGDFNRGWRNYAAREIDTTPIPLWDGSSLQDRRILLRAEQGFGDTIQFIRYARFLKESGANVWTSCPPQLARLLAALPSIDGLAPTEVDLTQFDCCAPLMHLPGLLGTTGDTIPADVPYLTADPQLVQSWGASLRDAGTRLKVGIAWRGSPEHRNDRNRSIEPADLSVLAGTPDTSFISLQAEHHCGDPAAGLPWHPLVRPLADFADTAALMMNLDLVISVDTAVAHLAGALARPVWTLIPFAPDWRWMLGRDDSPWYPTMRLFRQERRGVWSDAMHRVREALMAHS